METVRRASDRRTFSAVLAMQASSCQQTKNALIMAATQTSFIREEFVNTVMAHAMAVLA